MRLQTRMITSLPASWMLPAVGLLGLTFAGCTSEPASSPQDQTAGQAVSSAAPSATQTSEVKLAPPGDPTPPLDGGRLQATMPQDWKFLPRSSDYLFAAYYQDKSGVPRMILTQHDAADLPATDSAESAQKLAAQITSETGASADAAITTVSVGDNWFVRYESAKKFRSQSARGVTLETVNGGKRYRLELLTYTDAKDEFLPALYRFAASFEFAEGTEDAAPPEEPAAPEKPAEGEPVEEADAEAGEAAAAEVAP